MSVAANVAHSYVPPTGAPSDWKPYAGAVASAVVWPVILLVAVEILARTAWPTGQLWRWIRFGGLVPVAAVAAIVSYRHMSGLLHFYGEDGLTAIIGPLAVDGVMVMATGALIATALRRNPNESAEPLDAPADEREWRRGVDAGRRAEPPATDTPKPDDETRLTASPRPSGRSDAPEKRKPRHAVESPTSSSDFAGRVSDDQIREAIRGEVRRLVDEGASKMPQRPLVAIVAAAHPESTAPGQKRVAAIADAMADELRRTSHAPSESEVI